jgi:hypothetical protein
MRGLNQDRSARVIAAGHAFVQNVRRGHDELAVDEPATRRLAVALAGLALAIWSSGQWSLQHAAGRENATAPCQPRPGCQGPTLSMHRSIR